MFDVLRLAAETLPQLRILGRDAHRARILVADTHHDAAHGDQHGGCEAEFLRAQDRRDGDITPGHEFSVRLKSDPGAQSVLDQRLVSFGQTKLPGKSGVMDG